MKKNRKQSSAARKHRSRGLPIGGQRLKTELTFETNNQAYLWTTDRGRSRLIKH